MFLGIFLASAHNAVAFNILDYLKFSSRIKIDMVTIGKEMKINNNLNKLKKIDRWVKNSLNIFH